MWIVVILLSIIGWMIRREIGENDRFHSELRAQSVSNLLRITVLEAQFHTINKSLSIIEEHAKDTREKVDILVGPTKTK